MNPIKHVLLFILLGLLVTFSPRELTAQTGVDLSMIFEQLDSTQRSNFMEDLELLNNEIDFDDFEFEGVTDSLFQFFDMANLDVDSLLDAWGAGRDTLTVLLDSNGSFDVDDSLGVIGQYDLFNDIWINNLDSFGNLLTIFEDSISLDGTGEGDDRFDGSLQGLSGQGQNILEEVYDAAFDNTDAEGVGDADGLLGTLFSSAFDIELAFGAEWSNILYYGEKISPQATVFRVGSVPSYQAVLETRWHVQASFDRDLSNTMVNEGEINSEAFRPLLWGGEFSILFNPQVGFLQGSNTGIRLYSSLGMELQTNVPEYISSARPGSEVNVGKSTGFGPQVGAGFILNTPAYQIYTYGTFATGAVQVSPGYRYNSMAVNAGVRYGDVANFLYTFGETDWAQEDNKNAVYHRFTIGLLINHLFE
ncbi:MAG: hypothetical protein AAF798_22165 [Bacteroidota bacterium]